MWQKLVLLINVYRLTHILTMKKDKVIPIQPPITQEKDERMINGQSYQQWKGWVLSMAGGAHPDWSLRGKTVTPLTCISTSKSLSGCVNLDRTESLMCINCVPSSHCRLNLGEDFPTNRLRKVSWAWLLMTCLFQQFTDYPLVISPPLLQWLCPWVSCPFWASVSL